MFISYLTITFRLEELAVSYNGGKDCLVMLVLLLATVFKKYSSNNTIKGKLDAIYINSEAPFPTVCDFITKSATQFHLTPITILDGLKEGFKYYLNQTPKVKAIVVGIRHSDPYGSTLKYEQLTDGDWPRFLRIHPILHWDYVHIWDFLIGCNLEYCEMYDKGYTSLGGVNNTVRNPYLKQENGEYLPAYMLKDDADNRERLGRIKK